MSRYILFAGDNESPRGGWNDYKTSSEDLPDLVEYMGQIAGSHEWAHIVDTVKMKTVGSIICHDSPAGYDDDPKNQVTEAFSSDDLEENERELHSLEVGW